MTVARRRNAPLQESANLYPYQGHGARWLLQDATRLLLFEAGLGKTLTVIRAADQAALKHILVICPAVVRPHWSREFARWQQLERSLPRRHDGTVKSTDVVVLSYDQVIRGHVEELDLSRFGLLVLDEAQMLKSSSAKRTRMIYGRGCDGSGIVDQVERTWVLSGTLAPNGPHELWTHFAALYPQRMRLREYAYRERYCLLRPTQWGMQVVGVNAKHLPELKQLLRENALVRTKKQVLPQLPDLRFVTIPLSAKPVDESLSNTETEHLHAAVAQLDRDALNTVRETPQLSTARRKLGQAKVDATLELLRHELDADPSLKLVVFAVHRAVLEGLRVGLRKYGAVKVEGATTPVLREAAISAFQDTTGEERVFIGQIQAAGAGITLTAAHHVVFVEASWVPTENVQAACRCHRIGQNSGVLARFLCVEDTIDTEVMRVIARKTATLNQLWETAA